MGSQSQRFPLAQRALDYLFGYDFFLSYAHRDGDNYPRKLQANLEKSGFRVFLDESDTGFKAGDALPGTARRRVRMSQKLVVLGRETALRSDWVFREVEYCLEDGNIPVIININSSLQEAPEPSPIVSLVAEHEWKWINETIDRSDGDPTNETVAALVDAFDSTRQESKRARILTAAMLTFAVVSVAAIWQWRVADHQTSVAQAQSKIAKIQREIAERRSALLSIDTAENHRKIGKTDSSLLLLLEAARSFNDESAPDNLLIAFQKSIEHAQGQKTFVFAAESKYYKAGEDAIIFDPKAKNIVRLRKYDTQEIIQSYSHVVRDAKVSSDNKKITVLREDWEIDIINIESGVVEFNHRIDPNIIAKVSKFENRLITDNGLVIFQNYRIEEGSYKGIVDLYIIDAKQNRHGKFSAMSAFDLRYVKNAHIPNVFVSPDDLFHVNLDNLKLKK